MFNKFNNPKIYAVFKRSFISFLIIALLFTFLPGMAYGDVSETGPVLSDSGMNGFVEGISIFVDTKGTNQLQGYEFQSDRQSYDITFPDARGGTAPYVITIPDEYASGDSSLYCSFEINGTMVNLGKNNKKEYYKALSTKETRISSPLNLGTAKFPVGKETTLTIKVGKVSFEEDGTTPAAYTEWDAYTYHVTRSLTLNAKSGLSVKIKSENSEDFDQVLELSPKFDPQNSPYDLVFSTVVGEAEEVQLNLTATTSNTSIYVGDKEYSSTDNVYQIKDYLLESSENVAIFPIRLEYELEDGSKLETRYTLYANKVNLSPVITTQPISQTVEKGSDTTLSVCVETPSEGTLSYQWYTGENPVTGDKIIGATEAEYLPPSIYAGETTYCCVITNTIGDNAFVTTSDPATYRVNLTYLTAPQILKQPYIYGNNNSTIFVENGTPWIDVGIQMSKNQFIEGVPYEVSIYRNTENSTEGGTLLDCEPSSGHQSIGRAEIYSFSLPSQEIVGTYYYYVQVKVSKEGMADAVSVSTPLKLTFKSAKEVVDNLEGDGTAASPFLVYNEEDLQKVKAYVEGYGGRGRNVLYNLAGQTIALTNDIQLSESWEPIGNLKEGGREEDRGISLQPFSGILDGKGYTVTVADGGKPLFNYVRKATVKNLKIKGSHIQGYGLVDKYVVDYGETGSYVNDPVKNRVIDIENVTIVSGTKILKAGFIGGYASGANAVNIRNCTVEKNVVIGDDGGWGDLGDTSYGYGYISESFNHQDNIGSFAGAFNGTITNCVSYATVYGRKNVGGLVGMKGQSMGSCDVLNSSFQGQIISTGDRVGGIVGAGYISDSGPDTPTVEIHNCYVDATIKGNDKVGGLIGSEEGAHNFSDTDNGYGVKGALSVSDNHFYGKLEANGSNVGGILGYVYDFTKKSGDATNFYLDSCGANSAVGGAKTNTLVGVEKYGEAASKEAFSDGTILTKLNASNTSYLNWEMNASKTYPIISDAAVVTSLSIEGEYKTEYVLGEALDLSGIEIYANWSDNTRTKLDLDSEVTVSGYDPNTRGMQTITFQYKAIKATISVTVLKPIVEGQPNEITVRFTLYGDGIHNSDAEGATVHTLSGGNLQPWYANETYTVGVNSTVWDVLQQVEQRHSSAVKFHNQGNYIDYLYYDSSNGGKFDNTTKIGEFTNGKYSGWMYTLNGTHPLLGVEEQYLDAGDVIVWHYTDDYRKEEGSDKWIIPGEETDDNIVNEVTTTGAAGSATTTAPTEVKVSGTTATATIKAENQREILKQAVDKKSTEIILEVSKADSKGADSVQLSLEVSFVKNISDKTNADLTVNTEHGKVTLDQETIKTVLAEAKGSTIIIEIAKVTKPTEAQKKAAGTNGHLLKLTIKSGDKVISDFNKGKATVTVEIPANLQDKKVAAIHIAEDGKIEQLAGKILTIGGKKYYEFTTPHFSTFALVDADEMGLEVNDEEANVEKIKELVSDMSLKARSSKTSKKNIKVTLTVDDDTASAIKEIKDMGYTVKYKYYRSTKKASKYQAKITKTTRSFTNTAGKKGTRYYYKARIQVYDKDGNLVAQTALKQCRYAARTWTK